MGATVTICGGEPPDDDDRLPPTPDPPDPPPGPQCHTFALFNDHGPKLLGLMNEYLLDQSCEAIDSEYSLDDPVASQLANAFVVSHQNLTHAYRSDVSKLITHERFAMSVLAAMWTYAISAPLRNSSHCLVSPSWRSEDVREQVDAYLKEFPVNRTQWPDAYVTLATQCYRKIVAELKRCGESQCEYVVLHHLNVLLDILCEATRIYMFRRPQVSLSKLFNESP